MAWTAPSVQTTGTIVNAAIWNRDVTDNLTWLGASHDHNGGSGDGATLAVLPSGLILIFIMSCPSGWTRVSAWDGKFVRGAAAYGATGGAATHTHYYDFHNHNHSHAVGTLGLAASAGTSTIGLTADNNFSAHAHTHAGGALSSSTAFTSAFDGTSDVANTAYPPYIAVVFCKRN